MRKQFQNFLNNKQEKPQSCDHDETMWCQYCIAQGTKVDWREQGLGQGTIFINKPLQDKK
jgi:hypothetical protein